MPTWRERLYGFLGSEAGTPSVLGPAVATSPEGFTPGRPVTEIEDWRFASSFAWGNQRSSARGAMNRQLAEVMRTVRDLDPQLSFAIWQWLRLANNGHTVQAMVQQRMRAQDGGISYVEEVDTDGQSLLDDLARGVGRDFGGGMDTLLGVAFSTLLAEGAVAMEIEVSHDLKDIIDFHIVSPRRLEFRVLKDENDVPHRVLGTSGGAGSAGMGFHPVSLDQVRYFGLDPEVDNPYGHAPFVATLQAIYFKAQVLRDLRSVMHVSGNPRIDVSVLWTSALNAAPVQFKQPGNELKLKEWMQTQIKEIQIAYDKLEPDDGFVHYDWVKAAYIGPSTSGAVNADTIDKVLNRQIAASVKMLPMLMGMNETATETHGSLQWQIQVAGVESFQRPVKRMMEWAYSQSLEFYGLQSSAHFQFNKIRTVDELVEATARQVKSSTWLLAQQQNWVTGDEAANALYGHDAVGPDPQVASLEQQVQQLSDLLSGAANTGGQQAQDQTTLNDAANLTSGEQPAPSAKTGASVSPKVQLTPELMTALQKIVRDFASNDTPRRELVSQLTRLFTGPSPPTTAELRKSPTQEELVKAVAKYESDGKDALWGLLPFLRDRLQETGKLK